MNLRDFARAVRFHDWTACMSDDYSVTRRARANRKRLANLAETGTAHARVWSLGRAFEGNFTWRPSEKFTEANRFEAAWRWVGAYLWAHGVRLTEREASRLVAPVGTLDRWDRNVTGSVNWDMVDLLVKVHESSAGGE